MEETPSNKDGLERETLVSLEDKDKWAVWQNVIMYYDDLELPSEGICQQFLDIWEDDGLLTRIPGKYYDVPPTYIWS
jgi:hypothetical protein